MNFRKLRSPTFAQWELTPNCNYKCFHCYNYWRTSNHECEPIDYGIVVNQLIENHIFKVVLTGGEPLLVFEKAKPYIEKLLEVGTKISVNTNAALLTKKMAEFFKANDIGLLVSLPCAIPEINDKITNVKGSFDITVEGIKLARRTGVRVSVNMVVSGLNKDYIVETAKFLHDDLGLEAINVTKAERPINGVSLFDEYALNLEELRRMFGDLLFIKSEYSMFVNSLGVYPKCSFDNSETFECFSRKGCYAGRTNIAIGYNGDVKACQRDSRSYGNLKNKTLKECWDSMDEWRIVDYSKLPMECQNCEENDFCLGGCRVENRNSISDKCCRDVNKLPIEFEINYDEEPEFSSNDEFQVVDGLLFFEDNFAIRGINQYKEAFFVDKRLYQFIQQNNVFSKEKLMKEFNISSEDADRVLSYLQDINALNIL